MTWMIRDKTLSDYLEACKDAAGNLSNFKRDPRYTKILEHANYEIGAEYLSRIKRDNPYLLNMPGIFDGDEIGNPITYNFGDIICSPTTLQYIGVLSNLINHFGSLKGKRIVEIGAGYGGQAQVIQTVYEVSSYDIIDLQEASELQKVYLGKFNVVSDWFNERVIRDNWDLCISNYALSEIKDPVQTNYVEMLCKRSKHGYVTCNREVPALTLGKRSNDIKSERKENFIITW